MTDDRITLAGMVWMTAAVLVSLSLWYVGYLILKWAVM